MINTPDIEFATSDESPFSDGYDIKAERDLVTDLYNADQPDPLDPRYPRLQLLWEREETLNTMRQRDLIRQDADELVPDDIAQKKPGSLRSTHQMRIHTAQAHKIFIGRKKNEDAPAATGVMRFAACVFRVYRLTATANPLAAWVLIQLDAMIKRTQLWFTNAIADCKAEIAAMEKIGYTIEIKASRNPIVYENLSFGSPYGDAACHIVLLFDYYNRLLLTMEDTSMLTRHQFDKRSYEGMRKVRSLTEGALRVCSVVLKDPALCDLTPESYQEASAANPKLAKHIGPIPEDVLNGTRKPDHYKPPLKQAG